VLTPRRIVTALDERGVSYLARVEELAAAGPDVGRPDSADVAYPGWRDGDRPDVRVAWGCDELPFRLPVDPEATPSGAHPGPLGVRVSVVTYPAGWQGEMFWSNRVDVLWMLAGELVYRTDGGDEVVLRPGDVVIQNGTNKAFENRSAEPVTFGAVMFGAVNAGPTPPRERFHGAPHELPA
jgi:quercetin dioxygenase-like cupin family protein